MFSATKRSTAQYKICFCFSFPWYFISAVFYFWYSAKTVQFPKCRTSVEKVGSKAREHFSLFFFFFCRVQPTASAGSWYDPAYPGVQPSTALWRPSRHTDATSPWTSSWPPGTLRSFRKHTHTRDSLLTLHLEPLKSLAQHIRTFRRTVNLWENAGQLSNGAGDPENNKINHSHGDLIIHKQPHKGSGVASH